MESLVFLDTETTGLSSIKDRVIEIFMFKVYRGGEVEEFYSLINPKRPIPRLITGITGLTDQDVKDAPSEEAIAPKIRDFLGDGTIVAHNLAFDLRFLAEMLKRNNCAPI